MSTRIRGEQVRVGIDSAMIQASTSCTINIKANTADASAKDDQGGGVWDNQEYVNYEWSLSNDSFVCNIANLKTLLQEEVAPVAATTQVSFDVGDNISYDGTALISQLQLSASVDDYVKLSLSIEGSTPLVAGSKMTTLPNAEKKLRGKALMVGMKGADGKFHTIAAAKAHTLTISQQSSNTLTKDDNEKGIMKEVTGKSLTLSTENLVQVLPSANPTITGVMMKDIMGWLMEGKEVTLCFGYYADAMGKPSGSDEDWGSASELLVEGTFICTSLSVNGSMKENASYSAEFVCKGEPKFVQPVAVKA